MLRPTSRADIILHNALQQIQNSNMVPMPKQQRHCRGATENAKPDIARLEKTAPHRKGGHRKT